MVRDMPTPSEIRDRIAAIDDVLQSGVTSSTLDGETASMDHDTLRRERLALKRQIGTETKRHRVFNFNMGGR